MTAHDASAQAGSPPDTYILGGFLGLPDPVFYAYMEAGETLDLVFTKNWTAGQNPEGLRVVVEGPGGITADCEITAPATDGDTCVISGLTSASDGIWRIETQFGTGGAANRYTWQIDVSDGVGSINGRVWADHYLMQQLADDGFADFTFWYQSPHGYTYQATYGVFNGINSVFLADATGVRYNDTCTSAYASVVWIDQLGETPDPDRSVTSLGECGDPYKIFFDSPASDLPASALRWDGNTDWILPPIAPDPAITDVTFTPDGVEPRSGSIGYEVDNFTGQLLVEIDTNNDGVFDIAIPGSAVNGSGSVYFDGLDGNDDPVSAFQDMAVRVSISQVGEIHFVNLDVEVRSGGIEVIRLNGPGATDATLYWNDTELSTTHPCGNWDANLDGTGGFDSTGGVHWWDADGCGGITGGWGDARAIEEWTFVPVDESMQITIPAEVLPPFECASNAPGLLFQNTSATDPGQIYEIDLVTGSYPDPAEVPGRLINAIGYNVVDDYVYGWDRSSGQIVRVGSDGNVEERGVPTGVPTDVDFVIGDVDDNGHYWILAGSAWYQVDLATMTLVDDDTASPGAGISGGLDWAYVPGTDILWRAARSSTSQSVLIGFNRTTLTWTTPVNLGNLGGTGSDNLSGAMFADADGFLYVSYNNTGEIWRVDVDAGTATYFSQGPASSGNDGARCPTPVLIDFGDAPDSYGTLLADDGPRHGLRGYDETANTAPLMLGTQIDYETDGQPDDDAALDGFNDGVVSGIMLDTVNPIEVEMLVTNNTDEPATLVGWIDLDGTGSFDAGDRSDIMTIPANASGTFTLTFDPATTTADTYARFRLFPGEVTDPQPTGPASTGEVEDYPVTANIEIEIELTGGPCWRMLSSSVDGLTYADMLENLWTQGALGSDYPGGEPNIFLWPDGQSGNDPSGWQPLGDLNQVIPPGTGFLISVFADDDYDGVDDPFPKRLSISGPAHTGDITPPMNTTPGGWTLAGNPYSQPVDFNSLTTTDLTGVGYVWDRNTGNWASTTSDGFGDVTDGAFVPGQGFFVQNTDPAGSPSITFTEGSQTTGGEFYGKEKELRDYVRLEVQGESLTNSMWIRFSGDGSVESAYGDALELQPLAEQYALLGARKTDGTLVDIGHFPLPHEALEIPVHVEATQNGTYTITATELDIPTATELYLHDLNTGETVAITESFEYAFTISQATTKSTPDQGMTPCSASPANAKTTGGARFMITTSASGAGGELPVEVALGQNYPNPFNPATQITYELPQASEVHLEVFDMLGRRVATLAEGTMQAGVHQVTFDAAHLTSGVYLYRLTASGPQGGQQTFTKKLTLIK